MYLQINSKNIVDSLSNIDGSSITRYFILISAIIIFIASFLVIRFKRKNLSSTLNQDNLNQQEELSQSRSKSDKENEFFFRNKDEKNTGKILVTPKPLVKEEEPSKIKYIGYQAINVFAQSEPLSFPYVLMPPSNCAIKFPKKGRKGRKGFKEEDFKKHLDKYFRNELQLFDDRFILTKHSPNPYEPDFTLIDEKNGLNLFIDIEIDEPYEGLNNIEKRKATHFQYSDFNRNNAFKNRGWIVIRFAEIQIHQEPSSCCRYVADVIKSINSKFKIPEQLLLTKQISPVKQWTKDEALIWSKNKYREKYLGIISFGLVEENILVEKPDETKVDELVEEKVKDEPIIIPQGTNTLKDSVEGKITIAIKSNEYLSIIYNGSKTVIKPIEIKESKLRGYCYVKNLERIFNLQEMQNTEVKKSYYLLKVAAPNVGIESVKNAVNSAILYKKYVRMKYTRAAWSEMDVDMETGEFVMKNIIEREESIRTINNIQMANDVLDQEHINYYHLDENYINAYCNKREEKRTFKFDRIGEIEILDI